MVWSSVKDHSAITKEEDGMDEYEDTKKCWAKEEPEISGEEMYDRATDKEKEKMLANFAEARLMTPVNWDKFYKYLEEEKA